MCAVLVLQSPDSFPIAVDLSRARREAGHNPQPYNIPKHIFIGKRLG